MSEPLPAVCPVRSCSAREAVRASAAVPCRTALSTRRVWLPTSFALRAQAAQRAVTASCAGTVRRSAPVAAVSAIASAMDVSSVHSPGAQPKLPPPFIVTGASGRSGGPNSYAGAERVPGRGGEQDAAGAVQLGGVEVHCVTPSLRRQLLT